MDIYNSFKLDFETAGEEDRISRELPGLGCACSPSHLPRCSTFTLLVIKTYLIARAVKGYERMAHTFLLPAACAGPVAPLDTGACSPGQQGQGLAGNPAL